MAEQTLHDRVGGVFAIPAVVLAFAAHKGGVTEGSQAA
jgi:hypothetical protein